MRLELSLVRFLLFNIFNFAIATYTIPRSLQETRAYFKWCLTSPPPFCTMPGDHLPLAYLKRHWESSLVAINIFFLITGTTATILLERFYHGLGGHSKWLAALTRTAAFPVLFIPLFLIRCAEGKATDLTSTTRPSTATLSSIYFGLGFLIAIGNINYFIGFQYLSASSFSLICASQLAFNAVLSYLINSQKLSILISNSVIILSLSSALFADNNDSKRPASVSKSEHAIGCVCALVASALYSLLLSLFEYTFQKILKRETFPVVFEMQICASLLPTCVSIVGLFVSGEWRSLHKEMAGFGRSTYVLVVVWTAVSWQIRSVGVVGLTFVGSSLFASAISTASLAVMFLTAVICFHDKINGGEIIAMLLSFWGIAVYFYQCYIDHQSKAQKMQKMVNPVIKGDV